jgi:electron transport complex protein RnfD
MADDARSQSTRTAPSPATGKSASAGKRPAKKSESQADPHLQVTPSPHLSNPRRTTRQMMRDVLISLSPVMVAAVLIFGWYAVVQVGLCVLSCLAAEALFNTMRQRPVTLNDFSAVITGVILALSLPWSTPWFVTLSASFVAIGLGKVVYGGLGFNLFNPAMVGRAFVMLSFSRYLGAPAYVGKYATGVMTQATPLTALRQLAADPGDVKLIDLFLGTVNGSLGETSALALLVGGIYLCAKRSASWEIPGGTLLAAAVFGILANLLDLSPIPGLQHLLSGSLLFGAFFIATDPVTSPMSRIGKFYFGFGVGAIIVLLRVFSSYPDGAMFAVLLMNALTPLINRWTVPTPEGGRVA